MPLATRRIEAGVEIRKEAAVSKILVKNGIAQGVVLENGEEIHARLVSSSVDPQSHFPEIYRSAGITGEISCEDVSRYKYPRLLRESESGARRHCRISRACPAPGHHLRGAISISPSVEYMERAYDQAKYGEFSRRPYIDMVIPSLTDPSVAPPGKHVLSCFVQYAPYKLSRGHLGRAARSVRRHRD